MNKLIFIPKHQLNSNLIKLTLIVLAIISNVHFTKCNQNEPEFDLVKEGAISVFKFKNLVQNVMQYDDKLVIAGLNYAYLLKDNYYKPTSFLKKAFFSQPKNQHLSISEFKKPNLQLEDYTPTNTLKTNCSLLMPENCKSDQLVNINKVLYKLPSSLFFICGTSYYGQCFLGHVNDTKINIFNNRFEDNRYSLIGSKRSTLLINIPNSNVFLHAFEPDGRNESLRPGLVSKLTLSGGKKDTQSVFSFEPITHGFQKTMINIQSVDILKKFEFNFLYAFRYSKYAFVLKREEKYGHNLVTKLARVCLDDSSFFSYTEIPLSCKDENLTEEYTYASAAHFGQADEYLLRKTDIKFVNKTLFVTFNYYDNKEKNVNKTKGSVLCAFTIENLNDFYSHAINVCYDGRASETVGLMNQYSVLNKQTDTCSKVSKSDNYLCYGNNLNPYVEYKEKLKGHYLYKFEDVITSLITSEIKPGRDALNIFVLGTEAGTLHKLVRTFADTLELAHTFKIENRITEPINPNPFLGGNSNNITYFTSGKHMIKYPLDSCSIYSNCHQCLKAVDNLRCGWCAIENQNSGGCLNSEECKSLEKNENFKTSFSFEICPPIIETFTPTKGPLEGNTIIDIRGENLCNPKNFQANSANNPQSKVNVTIGKHWCEHVDCKNDILKCKTTKITSASADPIKVCTLDVGGGLGYRIDGCSFSSLKFDYNRTEVFMIQPNYGPIGGGTKISLIGNNLDSGRIRSVKIKESYCEEVSVSNDRLECLIKGIQLDNDDEESIKKINADGKIILEIDDSKYILDDPLKPEVKFEFKPNPTIVRYAPRAALRNSSINITMNGRYFASAHNLQLKTAIRNNKNEIVFLFSKCSMTNNSTLICKIPKVPDDIEIKSSQSPLETEIILIPDGEINVSKIKSNVLNFYYYPIPTFKTSFSQKQKVIINENKKGLLELKGINLSDQYDFEIKLIKIDPKSVSEKKIENMNMTTKFLLCKDKQVISFSKIKCQVDFNSESINSDILKSVWLARVEIPDQNPINVQLISFKFSEPATSKIMFISLFLILLVVLCAFGGTYYLHKTNRIEFTKEKKFPHFSIAYNSSPLMRDHQTMIDSPFIRQSSQNGIPLESKLLKKQELKENYKIRLAEDNILIPESCLKIIEKIGNGFFGCVYKGELNLPTKNQLIVAVKTLKNTSDQNSEAFQSLIEEAFLMKDFKHENVLTLIGVCLKDEDLPMIVLPFMANGDLLTYIRCEKNSPTVKELLYYGIDVGKGMLYLSRLKYVHRDLACRNCMMDENYRIKVADFGLTRDVYERNYYTSQHRNEIPIKWMSPESIEKYKTTTESDVWSYGILLWELMTRGNIPYAGFEGYQILDFIKQGNRLPKPETCPIEIFELMLDCWQHDGRYRPTFDQIVERIENLIYEKEEEVNIYSNLNVNYVNYPTEQYYSNNCKKRDTSPIYYNSSLSLGPTSPKATISLISTSIKNGNASANQLTTTSVNRMSTFKSQPSIKLIEMPTKQVSLNNLNNNDNIYNNDETIKIYDKKLKKEKSLNEDEIPLQKIESRKNSLNSASTNSTLSFKLNRQNAIDLNEADTRNYEYVMQTPHILIDKKSSSNKLEDADDDADDDEYDSKNDMALKTFEKTDNYVNPIKYFK